MRRFAISLTAALVLLSSASCGTVQQSADDEPEEAGEAETTAEATRKT